MTLVAVGVQFAVAHRLPDFDHGNFFGYFTILTNVLAGLVFLLAASRSRKPSRGLDLLRGATTTCLALVGITFSLLLANLESDVVPWVNVVLHYCIPVAVVVDWIVDPPTARLAARDALLWLGLPSAYVVYTLVRGSIVHWYPYPFLNVDTAGQGTVAAYAAGLFAFTSILAAAVLASGNALGARRDARLAA